MFSVFTVVLLISVSFSECWYPKPHTLNDPNLAKYLPFSEVDPGQALLLTPLIEQNKLPEARTASVVSHPDFKNVKSYSGFITVNKALNSSLFFWFFPSEDGNADAPVVIWLQGGPGGSSLYGLFIENGPFQVLEKNNLTHRNYSWTKSHSVLYIDNPVGTGFSFTKPEGLATNETQVGDQLFEFLQQFFTLFSEFQKNDLIITGESYAGKYIPAIGYAILKKNPDAVMKINLQGLAIGDGYTDPIHQYDYADYMYQLGLIDENIKGQIEDIQSYFINSINNKQWAKANEDSDKMLSLFSSQSGINDVYNYLQANDPTDILSEYYSEYVQRNDVRKALHVGNLPYDSTGVAEHLNDDVQQSVAPWVAELLNNYRVMLFSGQLDVIVAYPLTENYIKNLDFNGAEDYKTASRKIWYSNDKEVAGYVKVAGNLTEVLVRNAGHMVPFDQPKWAYELLYKFARKIPLA